MKKSTKVSLITVTIVVLLAVVGSNICMIEYSLRYPYPINVSYKDRFTHVISDNPETRPWIDSLTQGNLIHDTLVATQDDGQRHAAFVYAPQPTRRMAVMLYDYHGSHTGVMQIVRTCTRMSYNMLLPDHHAHGQSEGEMVQMGWKERHGVLRWMAIADSLFSDSTGHSEQVVHGISMGAALTTYVSGEDISDYVKCFVEDCGYTSIWDEFKNELRTQSGLPPFPLLYTASALNKLLYGWSFGEASPLKQVAKCRKPMLFIHEDHDIYMRTDMVYPLYKAKSQPRQLWIAKGSRHAESYKDHRQKCTEVAEKFVSRYIPQQPSFTPAGPPAVAFCTDDWPGITSHMRRRR